MPEDCIIKYIGSEGQVVEVVRVLLDERYDVLDYLAVERVPVRCVRVVIDLAI